MTTKKTNGWKLSSVVAEYLQETDILIILNYFECKLSHKKTSQVYCINIKQRGKKCEMFTDRQTDGQPVTNNANMNLEHILILS